MDPNGLPTAALVALGAIGVADLALLIVSVVRLARTPAERRSLPWPVWTLIIVVVHPIGAILFLAVGRRPVEITGALPAGEAPGAAPGSTGLPATSTAARTAAQAIDELYRPEQP